MRNCLEKVRRVFSRNGNADQLDVSYRQETERLHSAEGPMGGEKQLSRDSAANEPDRSGSVNGELAINKAGYNKNNNNSSSNNQTTSLDTERPHKGIFKLRIKKRKKTDKDKRKHENVISAQEKEMLKEEPQEVVASARVIKVSGELDMKSRRYRSGNELVSAGDDALEYIEDLRAFVEEKSMDALATPYPTADDFSFEHILNRSTQGFSTPNSSNSNSNNNNNQHYNSYNRAHSLRWQLPKDAPLPSCQTPYNTPQSYDSSTPNSLLAHSGADGDEGVRTSSSSAAKTPEQIEYEAKLYAESQDVMTPLPSSTLSSIQRTYGRNLPPEIAEVIRNLDAKALHINNLTNDDKLELMRRLDGQHRRHSHNRTKSYMRLANEQQQQQQQQLVRHAEECEECDADSTEGVVLRRQLIQTKVQQATASCLYERRLPAQPKLKLVVKKEQSRTQAEQQPEADAMQFEKNLMDVKYPTVLPPNPQLKALLVFHKPDNMCEVLTQACHRQHLEVTVVKKKEAALEALTSPNPAECYHLIIIDARTSKYLDAEYIARSIRHTQGHQYTTIIAVVKKSFFEKDDVFIALLDAGVNRCIAETANVGICSIELKQILHSIVRPHNVMSTQQTLYTALHRLKEVLIITDNVLRIQYANKSAERLLNMRLDEIISKPLADIFVSDVSTISMQGKCVKEFDGILTVRRKSQDGIPMHVRIVPVACIGRSPTHFVFNFDVPGGQSDFIATLPQPKEAPRGSLHSIRRGSFDVRSVASDGLRRTSLAKLTSLPLEAPITKIINLLSQVQENCSSDEARLIDKVMEFLKREGLYSPQMKEIHTEDPIATDLIGALLTGPSLYSSRRSSNDSIIRVSTNRTSGLIPAKMKATPLVMELLDDALNWEFDIFKLEEISDNHPLLYMGMEIFRRFDVFATCNADETTFKHWLIVMEAHYHADNTYHNSTHAADVVQATGAFMTQLATKEWGLDRMDEAVALIASAAHDLDHPGRSSAYLCNSRNPLAILYNDLGVLESHHAATTFKLTLADDKINIFKNLDAETYKNMRSTIIDMILATEMTRHFEHLAKFVSVFGTDPDPRDIVHSEDENAILIRRMMIKVADVSNPARPFNLSMEWSKRIAEEYFQQTDEEKSKGLPIMMPMFDRATCSISKSQIGFIEYIIQDMVHAWDSFIDMPQLVTHMQINYAQWKKLEEQGIHTMCDVKSKLASYSAKKSIAK